MTEEDLAIISTQGWLSLQPEAFRAEVLRRAVLQVYPAGEAIYHLGDPVGGIYGLVSGLMTVTTAPGSALPRLIHVGTPGTWTGEGPFMTGQPRRLTLRAAVDSHILHLPLEAMEQLVEQDPRAARRFGQIPLTSIDTLLRVIHDLLIRDPDRRIAAVLLRAGATGTPIPLSQTAIGEMASATRKQVNAALGRFAAQGWITRAYRLVLIKDPQPLRAFVATEDEG